VEGDQKEAWPLKRGYRIEFRPSAADELEKLPSTDRRRIGRRIDALAQDPRPQGIRQLDKGIYRLRAGDYRVIYQIRDEVLLVLVIRIGHRSDVYRALSRIIGERRRSR
jgi:mRNA interferase RelE/StbE